MCECFQIGGRFIAEDPDCPAHGAAAQRIEKERDEFYDDIQRDLEIAKTTDDLRNIIARLLESNH